MRLSKVCRFVVHSPRGINFTISTDEAVVGIREKYGKRWFGAQLDYLDLHAPSKEFLPFYLCRGRVRGSFTGQVSYSEPGRVDASGKSMGSTTRYITTGPQDLDSIFEENQTQVYAGYKYNIKYVHYALKNEANAINMVKMNLVDTTNATINLFEQSTMTLKEFVEKEVREQATQTAKSIVRSFHPTADSVSVTFNQLDIKIDEVTPCFVPCYVVRASYDGQDYTLYVNGMLGTVGGPYLINALYVGRVTALSTVALGVLLTPNKVAGTIFGLMASVVAYFIAFHAARLFPSYRRDWYRREREHTRQQHLGGDQSGFRPSADSRRTQFEYEHSSYWDTHRFQQRKRRMSSFRSSSSSSSTAQQNRPRDPKGYYKALGLTGEESVNEIRSAYRQLVLRQHPDVGGSNTDMAKINEAYRILRDPARRAEYDAL